MLSLIDVFDFEISKSSLIDFKFTSPLIFIFGNKNLWYINNYGKKKRTPFASFLSQIFRPSTDLTLKLINCIYLIILFKEVPYTAFYIIVYTKLKRLHI